ncbi:Uncharacterized protein YnzC, UPF0291/DUF896 family [Paenibacillus sp. OK003]|uniref:UPF0291 protein DET56_11752 n=2 Tax=Paenibacillus TaxID=44249 RepID=A0A855XRD0_9BACL|nr:uncharacterized protein YnzC (UPF0291/DUF896 family) [Paenibacillus pabuli]PXV99973.1 uncharacterized protein YnzC (UPF0291/DUF896 family) [Paenibacillus taichungensis]SEL82131.1 Uncharacterized protein YnzC, UPF0291/DUF896 family [Paenibacillus sp. OK003]
MMIPTLTRINELSRKAKAAGLTEMEKAEQIRLRQEYLLTFRGSINDILLNVTIYDPNGDDVTPDRLKQEQAQQNNN